MIKKNSYYRVGKFLLLLYKIEPDYLYFSDKTGSCFKIEEIHVTEKYFSKIPDILFTEKYKSKLNKYISNFVSFTPDENLPKSITVKKVLSRIKKPKPYRVPQHLRWFIGNLFDWKCLNCGKTKEEITITIDHIIPKSWEQNDNLDNLQTLCWDCNGEKYNLFAIDYRYPIFKDTDKPETPIDTYIRNNTK